MPDFAPQGEGAELDLAALADRHRAVIEALTAAPNGEGAADEDGSAEALSALFDDLALSNAGGIEGRFVDYPAFFATLARQRTLNPASRAAHRRVKILGLLEARLLTVDRIVLGGLDEGIWPPRTETDAFLNRPMRARIGLSPPERRIGQTAHDFVQLLGCADVVITRAQKRNGSPMVPSRFLQRIKAFVGTERWEALVKAGARYRALARVLETPQSARLLPRPAPKPDPALFPRSLSVTEIETLVRDPYSIFARHILKLDALEPIAGEPGAADRGTHHSRRRRRLRADLSRGAARPRARRSSRAGLARLRTDRTGFSARFTPCGGRASSGLREPSSDWEEERRPSIARVHAERSGAMPIALSDGSLFTLRARADRIEESDRRHLRRHRFQDRPAAGHKRGLCRLLAATDP